ncbi:EAL and HDOD domain-containing protein [Glaciecola sp. KUL10]|uniref:EAL and HDOD domain-containing protein n=1 Tax=Glaciecola sp. (strain KUL10) TaxID=2161813 RepID=UPI000D78B4EE|nr:HDOD domain-containing protein [Glaciecola sp. KUL10]GBL03829.1 diguanylate phosphodiesterase [Glaciecola sp. KUL10]
MRFAFFARQAIFDRHERVFAYSLAFRDGKNAQIPYHPEEKQKSIEKRLETLSLADISSDKLAFIEFSDQALINHLVGFNRSLPFVIHITLEQINNAAVFASLTTLKEQHQICLQHTSVCHITAEQRNLLSYIALPFDGYQSSKSNSASQLELNEWRKANINLLITDIDSLDAYTSLKYDDVDFFQGKFFLQLDKNEKRELPASKVNVLALLAAINDDEFDLTKVAKLTERDASISYALLRFINSPFVNKRTKISSLEHAITYLGEIEVKKFVALIAVVNLANQSTEELLNISLIRAKFIELMLEKTGQNSLKMTGFMLGLLSLLDIILEQPMQDILHQIPVAAEINDTLSGEETVLSPLITVVKGFESALWQNVIKYSIDSGHSQIEIHHTFNQAILWANEINQASSAYFPRTKPS